MFSAEIKAVLRLQPEMDDGRLFQAEAALYENARRDMERQKPTAVDNLRRDRDLCKFPMVP